MLNFEPKATKQATEIGTQELFPCDKNARTVQILESHAEGLFLRLERALLTKKGVKDSAGLLQAFLHVQTEGIRAIFLQ